SVQTYGRALATSKSSVHAEGEIAQVRGVISVARLVVGGGTALLFEAPVGEGTVADDDVAVARGGGVARGRVGVAEGVRRDPAVYGRREPFRRRIENHATRCDKPRADDRPCSDVGPPTRGHLLSNATAGRCSTL